jgi:hypothetical protein
MFLTETKSKIKSIRQGDPDWFIVDGLMMAPRAGLIIDNNCPREYKMIIATCINNGWLRPIAHQPVHEHFMEELSK